MNFRTAVNAPLQDVFDFIATHLLTQNKKALLTPYFEGQKPACAYRAKDGSKCAVGCLLADDEYRPGLEGNPVGDIAYALDLTLDPTLDVMLSDLQLLHDENEPEAWPEGLKRISDKFGLQPPKELT